MPIASGKMNARELEICSRFKELRKQLKWSQPNFAESLGISLNQLASIEYGRTPLRYSVAWSIRILFGINLEWLSTGNNLPNFPSLDFLPKPDSTGLSVSALLSEVFDNFNESKTSSKHSKKIEIKAKVNHKLIMRRAFLHGDLCDNLEMWLSVVGDAYLDEFSNLVRDFMTKSVASFPQDDNEIIRARVDALMWEIKRREVHDRVSPSRVVEVLAESGLTGVSLKSNNADVKPEIQKLIERVNRKASRPGAKAELAKILDVAPARISEWLSGKKEPGGDYTLRLLKWVEQA